VHTWGQNPSWKPSDIHPDDGLIVYENSESDFLKAFLIAHELGHTELGDDREEPAQTLLLIDPVRSAEPPRAGADRIVDYGRHQRREIQMDLFAREFLFPRNWLRHLLLNEGMTAETIASKVGASYEVIAQQMLDALLLPEQLPSESTAKPPPPLNRKQRLACAHRGKPFILEAGPGTGKTATLVARVEHLLRNDKVDPRRVLVLTFSNKAAGEIVDRIAMAYPAAASAMWIGTFHAFGLDMIRRFSGAFGVSDEPSILDRVDAIELLEREFARLPLKHHRDIYDPSNIIVDMLAAISRAKDEVVDAETYAQLAQRMLAAAHDETQRISAEKALEVAHVYRLYEQIKHDRSSVDFGDLVMRPVHVLEGNSEVREQLRAAYDHILVDEYQDVNRSSVRLLAALTQEGRNLWVVGDALQSIYRFRGASSFNMQRFGSTDFPDGVRDRLELNYRSSQEILDAAGSFAKGMQIGGNAETLQADRGRNGRFPRLSKVNLAEDQAIAIAEAAKALAREGCSFQEQAVLCTGNEKLAEMALALERLDVPVLYLGNLFERDEVKDLLALASLLVDGWSAGMLRTACMPGFEMSLEDVVASMKYSREHEDEPGRWRAHAPEIDGLSDHGRASLGRLAQALDGFDERTSAWDVLARMLVDRTSIASSIARSTALADRTRGIALWVLMNFLRTGTVGAGTPIRRSLDRIRRLVRFFDDRDLRQLPGAAQALNAVRLMTVHGAKGLEFSVVHFAGINKGAMPHLGPPPRCLPPDGMIEGVTIAALAANQADREAEQECLFYVALTRARDRLLLYAATRDKAGKNRALSPYVERMGPGVEVDDARLSSNLPPEAIDAAVPIEIDGPVRLSAAMVGRLGKCRRQVLYSYLLGIGGGRRHTPFTDMHSAVRLVVATIVKDDVRDESQQSRLIDAAFEEGGLDKHGYAADYKQLARGMIRTLHASRAGLAAEPASALVALFGSDEVQAVPDDVLRKPDGSRLFRQIMTGKARDHVELGPMAFSHVVRAHDPGAGVEFVSLADGHTTLATLTDKQLSNGRAKINAAIQQLRVGDFAPSRSAYICPSCPAFFVCGKLPPGRLKKVFEPLPV
jgi:superfamily I DNA/RNA helicase/Zn-dependent peptidase ImmA (M78 family)